MNIPIFLQRSRAKLSKSHSVVRLLKHMRTISDSKIVHLNNTAESLFFRFVSCRTNSVEGLAHAGGMPHGETQVSSVTISRTKKREPEVG